MHALYTACLTRILLFIMFEINNILCFFLKVSNILKGLILKPSNFSNFLVSGLHTIFQQYVAIFMNLFLFIKNWINMWDKLVFVFIIKPYIFKIFYNFRMVKFVTEMGIIKFRNWSIKIRRKLIYLKCKLINLNLIIKIVQLFFVILDYYFPYIIISSKYILLF